MFQIASAGWLQASAGVSAAPSEGRPRRLVIVYTPHGVPPEYFWPALPLGEAVGSPGAPLSPILAPLAPFRDRMVLLRGLDMYGAGNHEAMASLLTNGGKLSIDQEIAGRLVGTTPWPSLQLGVIPDERRRFTERGQWVFSPEPLAHRPDPVAAFDALFGATAHPARDRSRRRVAAFVNARLEARRAWARGRPDAPAIEDGLTAHEASLARVPGVRGSVAASPRCADVPRIASVEALRQGGIDPWDHASFAQLFDAQLDLAVAALRCDATRIITLQSMSIYANVPFSFIGVARGHHDVTHSDVGTTGRTQHADCQRWYATRLVRLLEGLSVPDPLDPAHTLLDNTTLLWCSEISDGQEHNCQSNPFVLFGGGAGLLKGGLYLDFGGRSHGALLVTLARLMGVVLPQVGTERDPEGADGPLLEVLAT